MSPTCCHNSPLAKETGQSPTHQSFLRLYRREVGRTYDAVRAWMGLTVRAIELGVTAQLIRGEIPLLDSLEDYDAWKPKSPLEKALIERRADILFDKAEPFGDVTTNIADWHCIRNRGGRMLARQNMRIYGKAMDISGQIARVDTTWNVKNHFAIEWAAKRTAERVALIVDSTRQALRQVISAGIDEGMSIPQIARRIKDMEGIGLNARQMGAMRKYEGALRSRFSEMKGGLNSKRRAKMRKMLRRESRKKLRYRAQMIARTETADAVSEGSLQGYRVADVRRVVFEASADACPGCAWLDGNEYGTREAGGVISVHPNCRCSWRPKIVPGNETAPRSVSAEDLGL